MQLELLNVDSIARDSDIVYTPEWVSRSIIEKLDIHGNCLDPCKGDGAYFKFLPKGSEYCELREGTDFLKQNKYYNWIVGNPPYSIFEYFLRHSFNT